MIEVEGKFGIELFATAINQLLAGSFANHRPAIDRIGGHGVERVSNSKHPGTQRQTSSGGTIGVSATLIPTVGMKKISSKAVSVVHPRRIPSPCCTDLSMINCSSTVSLPGFRKMRSGIPIFPTSCSHFHPIPGRVIESQSIGPS